MKQLFDLFTVIPINTHLSITGGGLFFVLTCICKPGHLQGQVSGSTFCRSYINSTWARRALNREGYRVVDDPDSPIQVQAAHDHWLVKTQDETFEGQDIASLLQTLRSSVAPWNNKKPPLPITPRFRMLLYEKRSKALIVRALH